LFVLLMVMVGRRVEMIWIILAVASVWLLCLCLLLRFFHNAKEMDYR